MPEPPPPPPSAPPAAPVEQTRPTGDNCGLTPAEMDHQTKVECGRVEQPQQPPTVEEQSSSGEGDLESKCSGASWRSQMGDTGDAQCGTDWEDGNSSNQDTGAYNYLLPHTDCTWADSHTVYCEGPGGSYSYQPSN
ncbi:hypothetical protein EIL87_08960 [Saccharopolyspora rhizosphaerae]|uniref:Uncharacterized protein n=1 Tax=Saccharopolyspora rhizosphaerae TaxID=2492662 RepID=A0A426JYW5_9PSEU|nr:hypothetical protein [Saccharopolyspora rhizosphaerae]RRO18344.1 hypothetical protein EIL87_08960 [Saccharopolyspora rhizosphaerae]